MLEAAQRLGGGVSADEGAASSFAQAPSPAGEDGAQLSKQAAFAHTVESCAAACVAVTHGTEAAESGAHATKRHTLITTETEGSCLFGSGAGGSSER